jgi:hypothetical protein
MPRRISCKCRRSRVASDNRSFNAQYSVYQAHHRESNYGPINSNRSIRGTGSFAGLLFHNCDAGHLGVVHDDGRTLLSGDLHVLELNALGVLNLQAGSGGRDLDVFQRNVGNQAFR